MSAIIDITLHKKNVFIIARIDNGKSLTYQSITKMSQSIVLALSPIIAFVDNQ